MKSDDQRITSVDLQTSHCLPHGLCLPDDDIGMIFQDLHVQKNVGQNLTQSVREGIRKKIRDYLGIFPNIGGGGGAESQKVLLTNRGG